MFIIRKLFHITIVLCCCLTIWVNSAQASTTVKMAEEAKAEAARAVEMAEEAKAEAARAVEMAEKASSVGRNMLKMDIRERVESPDRVDGSRIDSLDRLDDFIPQGPHGSGGGVNDFTY